MVKWGIMGRGMGNNGEGDGERVGRVGCKKGW